MLLGLGVIAVNIRIPFRFSNSTFMIKNLKFCFNRQTCRRFRRLWWGSLMCYLRFQVAVESTGETGKSRIELRGKVMID